MLEEPWGERAARPPGASTPEGPPPFPCDNPPPQSLSQQATLQKSEGTCHSCATFFEGTDNNDCQYLFDWQISICISWSAFLVVLARQEALKAEGRRASPHLIKPTLSLMPLIVSNHSVGKFYKHFASQASVQLEAGRDLVFVKLVRHPSNAKLTLHQRFL